MRSISRVIFPATVRATISPKPQSSFRAFSNAIDGIPPFIDQVAELAKKSRIDQLREKLRAETPRSVFEISRQGQSLLGYVNNTLNKKYSRGGKFGEGLVGVEEVVRMATKQAQPYYEGGEARELLDSATPVQSRMRVKVSESYLTHAFNVPKGAKNPNPILKVVMPSPREVDDLSGEVDPSNQNRYSPLPGLLHKYDMLLALVSINCSSHCRYCYRLDLFNGSSGKTKTDMAAIAAYIKTFNALIDTAIKDSGRWDKELGMWFDTQTDEPLTHIKEILLSGGDPMTLPNSTIARYLVLMAEAGIEQIRFGTKELVFNPQRFDGEFWKMMDLFHENYSDVRIDIVGHYVHPFELIDPKINNDGEYIYDVYSKYNIREDVKPVIKEINTRGDWIEHYNQFPIIAGINDSPEIIRLLVHQGKKMGIETHNIYACREIVGNAHFRQDNTIERQYDLVEKSKSSLSGLENKIRLVMSTEYGKLEVSIIDGSNVLLKINRFINDKQTDDNSVLVDTSKLPEGQKFYWLTDEVIDLAVNERGKQTLKEISSESKSLISQLKKLAASQVLEKVLSSNDPLELSSPTKSCPTKLEIEVVSRNGGSRIIEVDLSDEIYSKRPPTLATILKKEGLVEAACDEQLSCSTCVGDVESKDPLQPATEDEQDLIDTAPSASPSARATCQIPAIGGGKYKFTVIGLEECSDDKSK